MFPLAAQLITSPYIASPVVSWEHFIFNLIKNEKIVSLLRVSLTLQPHLHIFKHVVNMRVIHNVGRKLDLKHNFDAKTF